MQIRQAGEERFHTVFDHAAVAMARHALNGDILEVNDSWCKTFGYVRKSDEVFWVEVRVSLVHDERGAPDY